MLDATARPVLVTGAAGFIGFHVARRLLAEGVPVVGVDNVNAYYDPALKEARLANLAQLSGFTFHRLDLADTPSTAALFAELRPRTVIHLAAQAGVRYSLTNPHAYASSNLTGFLNVLEGARHAGTGHLVFASSSSVYGANTRLPFTTTDTVDHPVSLYAATKKANELMAHTYSHLFRLPVTGLRFFTVYGPWGRPDMAYYSFTKAIIAGTPIPVFAEGRLRRDFTYVDDVVEGVLRVAARPPIPDPAWNADDPAPNTSNAPYRVYNIGNHSPVTVNDFVAVLEQCIGRKAVIDPKPMQPGDVEATFADVTDLTREFGFAPRTPLAVGLRSFVDWYRAHHGAE
jgi:UDP-glucuronate 4-epimerase